MPAKPEKVIGLAPADTPNLAISDSPRAIKAAFAFTPNSNPSHIPEPIAIMFLSAPPNSTPIISSLAYTLNLEEFIRD